MSSVGHSGSFDVPTQQYEEVAEHLRARIDGGEFPPGARLPSRAQLRDQYGVSASVVDKAFILLRFAKITETLPGVGVFVRADYGPPKSDHGESPVSHEGETS